MSGATAPCPKCKKLLSKSNMSKHKSRCGKKKPPKTRKAINRDAYARNKGKILAKRREQRVYERYRRLEVARENLAELKEKPCEVAPMKEREWMPEPESSPWYGISQDPDFYGYVLSTVREKCKTKHGHGPMTIEYPKFFKEAMLILHPDKVSTLKNKFGEHVQEYALVTVKALSNIKSALQADTDDIPPAEADTMSDVDLSRAERELRKRRYFRDQAKMKAQRLQASFSIKLKAVEKYLASCALHRENYQKRKEAIQEQREIEIKKLEKIIEGFELNGPCSTFEEFKETEQARFETTRATGKQ